MLLLAGVGLAGTGALVTFGALTGRLAAMLAAVFVPADLSTGYYVRPGGVDPLNTTVPQPGNGGAQPGGLGDYLGGLTAGTNPFPYPTPKTATIPALPGTQKAVPAATGGSLTQLLTGGTK